MRAFRLLTKLVLLGFGGGVAAVLLGKRLRPAPLPPWNADDEDRDEARPPRVMRNDFDVDPADPVQALDEASAFHIEDLDVDASSVAENEEDLDIAEAESFAESEAMAYERAIDVSSEQPTLDTLEARMHDTGDLYGMHTPPAVDRDHPDDDHSMEAGENWVESLQANSIENGALPELELDGIIDDADIDEPPHPTDTRDLPVADRGSGGPGGV